MIASINTSSTYYDGNGDATVTPVSICNNKNGTVLIILSEAGQFGIDYSEITKNTEIDLSDNSYAEANSSDPILIKYYIDLFDINYLSYKKQENKYNIYNNSTLVITLNQNFYDTGCIILFLDNTSNTIVKQKSNPVDRSVYSLTSISKTNPQKLVELDL